MIAKVGESFNYGIVAWSSCWRCTSSGGSREELLLLPLKPRGSGGGRKEERKKSLTRGHVEDIGSAWGIHSYRGQGYEGDIAGK